LTPESWEMKDKEMGEAVRLHLKPEDIPFCKHIGTATVLSE